MNIVRLILVSLLIVALWVMTVAADGPVNAQLLQMFTVALVIFSPVFLKLLPESLKGFPMLVAAVVVSSALALLNMYIGGAFNHFDIGTLALYLGSFAGAQQIFFAALKDSWHLADPPQKPGQPAAYSP